MSRKREDQEGPCLHCLMVELIDDFFAEYPTTAGSDKVDTDEADEVIDAIAKTVAEMTSQQDGVIRQQVASFAVKTRQVQSRLMLDTKGGPAEIGPPSSVRAIPLRVSHARIRWLLSILWMLGKRPSCWPQS